ncbi:hypothetical protein SIL72_03655 [Rubrobacter radiotolerans]|uniref:Uncharacterized protein n=1 Tax=Rubrobacter radiotolerans TaxID=42256 RepID=A0AB35T0G2_RUBRA|nr:hypothetical protein [Rubrobacter radiotolerans]MDX5893121.1 hypothetical protein [Rubrobacter radiotolerans]
MLSQARSIAIGSDRSRQLDRLPGALSYFCIRRSRAIWSSSLPSTKRAFPRKATPEMLRVRRGSRSRFLTQSERSRPPERT